MKQIQIILLTLLAAALLAGCGTIEREPGYHVQANRGEDFALTCDEALQESQEAKRQIAYIRENGLDIAFSRNRIRDYTERLRVLHSLMERKGCDRPQAAEATNSGAQQQPAPKEKSRVVLCAEGQSCVVE